MKIGTHCLIILLLYTFSQNAAFAQMSNFKPKDDSDLIIEGTVIATDRQFFQDVVYNSCLVEINKVFKEEIQEKVIEVVVIDTEIRSTGNGCTNFNGAYFATPTPALNSTAIFWLKALSNNSKRNVLSELTPFRSFYVTETPQLLSNLKMYKIPPLKKRKNKSRNYIPHIEKEIYQQLEQEFGRKSVNIQLPATTNKVALQYLKRHKKRLPNRQKGIVYELRPRPKQYYHTNDSSDLVLYFSSSNAMTYLHQGTVTIEYNTTALGSNIVANGTLVYPIPPNHKAPHSLTSGGLPKHFEVTIKDIAPNQFEVCWKNKTSPDSSMQVFPNEFGLGHVVAKLYLSPINANEPLNFTLLSSDSLNLHYDYEQQQVVPYEYAAISPPITACFNDLYKPIITTISPERTGFPLTDTIIIRGKYLGKHCTILLYAKSKIAGSQQYKQDYIAVPERYVLRRTTDSIVVVIPKIIEKGE